MPAAETLESLFAKTCEDGLARRFAHMRKMGTLTAETVKTYRNQLTMEIDVIQKMGFAGYFLIVADFINWAKEHDIPVGPGRGSGAGSLAAYCMQITDIDPIPYGLLFERFLNVERVSMPDFDVDFCKDRRDEVIKYVRQKYGGDEHVAQIVTYGTMKARAVIRDVGRVLEIPLPKVDRIAKLIPDELKITLEQAMEKEPRLREAIQEEDIKQLLEIARTLEGLYRHTSTHAAGVVISPEPMVDYLPVCIGQNKEVLTQYDMKYTEMTGLIKFDFLGLKTLTVIDRALKLIKKDLAIEVDLSSHSHGRPEDLCPALPGRQPGGVPAGKRRHARAAEEDEAGSSSPISSLWSPCTGRVPWKAAWSTPSSRPSTAASCPNTRCPSSRRSWRRPTG